jgi:hypothetical protein
MEVNLVRIDPCSGPDRERIRATAPAEAAERATSSMNDVTRILSAIEQGDPKAALC